MATISVTIPDPVAPRVLDTLCRRWQYDASGGQTKAQFVRGYIARLLRSECRAQEASEAGLAAEAAAASAADSEIVIS